MRHGALKEEYRKAMRDNERLRALILEAEQRGCKCGSYTEPSGCPWCVGPSDFNGNFEHTPDCRAFSAKGVVR